MYTPIGSCVKCPDLSGDGLVSGIDSSIINDLINNLGFDPCVGDQEYNAAYDLNDDFCIDQNDIVNCIDPYLNVQISDLSMCCTCGNGIVEQFLGEQCDDGNNINGDGCSVSCIVEPHCGNGECTPEDINCPQCTSDCPDGLPSGGSCSIITGGI